MRHRSGRCLPPIVRTIGLHAGWHPCNYNVVIVAYHSTIAQGVISRPCQPGRMQIDVWQGDITRCPGVEAVVNAANEALAAGGGVCGAIFRAAGTEALTAACRAVPPPVETGSAASTDACGLSAHG